VPKENAVFLLTLYVHVSRPVKSEYTTFHHSVQFVMFTGFY